MSRYLPLTLALSTTFAPRAPMLAPDQKEATTKHQNHQLLSKMLLSVEIFGADLGALLTLAVHQENERILWQEGKAEPTSRFGEEEDGAEM